MCVFKSIRNIVSVHKRYIPHFQGVSVILGLIFFNDKFNRGYGSNQRTRCFLLAPFLHSILWLH